MSNNTATIKTRKNLVSTRTITMTALLAAISYVLAFLEFPVPLSPSFDEYLSDLPALIGAIAMMIYKKLTPILKGENLK
ncbi:MAG: hypothetical protein ACLUTO_00855 [Anaerostipes sp.]